MLSQVNFFSSYQSIGNPDITWQGGGNVAVAAGSGTATISITLQPNLPTSDNYYNIWMLDQSLVNQVRLISLHCSRCFSSLPHHLIIAEPLDPRFCDGYPRCHVHLSPSLLSNSLPSGSSSWPYTMRLPLSTLGLAHSLQQLQALRLHLHPLPLLPRALCAKANPSLWLSLPRSE